MGMDVPLFLLVAAVCAYWGTIIFLAFGQRLRHGRSAGLLPRDAYERRLWMLVIPVVVAWLVLPILASYGRVPGFRLPHWARDLSVAYILRWAAATSAIGCYLLSCYCWLLMGRHWSMAIVPGQTSRL